MFEEIAAWCQVKLAYLIVKEEVSSSEQAKQQLSLLDAFDAANVRISDIHSSPYTPDLLYQPRIYYIHPGFIISTPDLLYQPRIYYINPGSIISTPDLLYPPRIYYIHPNAFFIMWVGVSGTILIEGWVLRSNTAMASTSTPFSKATGAILCITYCKRCAAALFSLSHLVDAPCFMAFLNITSFFFFFFFFFLVLKGTMATGSVAALKTLGLRIQDTLYKTEISSWSYEHTPDVLKLHTCITPLFTEMAQKSARKRVCPI